MEQEDVDRLAMQCSSLFGCAARRRHTCSRRSGTGLGSRQPKTHSTLSPFSKRLTCRRWGRAARLPGLADTELLMPGPRCLPELVVLPSLLAPFWQTHPPLLCELFEKFMLTSSYIATVKEVKQEAHRGIGMRHWIQTPEGFGSLRDWMVAQSASENIDFIR